ncbi:LemA family protein [Siccirubricoccus deserti]
MIALRQTTSQAWSNVDVQFKRRHDLIPNLVGR